MKWMSFILVTLKTHCMVIRLIEKKIIVANQMYISSLVQQKLNCLTLATVFGFNLVCTELLAVCGFGLQQNISFSVWNQYHCVLGITAGTNAVSSSDC